MPRGTRLALQQRATRVTRYPAERRKSALIGACVPPAPGPAPAGQPPGTVGIRACPAHTRRLATARHGRPNAPSV